MQTGGEVVKNVEYTPEFTCCDDWIRDPLATPQHQKRWDKHKKVCGSLAKFDKDNM